MPFVLLFQENPGAQWHSHASDLVSEAQKWKRLRDLALRLLETPMCGFTPVSPASFFGSQEDFELLDRAAVAVNRKRGWQKLLQGGAQ